MITHSGSWLEDFPYVAQILRNPGQDFSAFLVSLTCAQIAGAQAAAPQIPGIYGGAPIKERGTYRFVELQGASGDNFILPLNGILNYVALYDPTNGEFIPGGEYSVLYLNAGKAIIGSAGSVVYSPNIGYTNGVEVSTPNPGADGALGIQGVVEEFGAPTQGIPVTLFSTSGSTVAEVTTNGDGFFSLYYGTNPKTKTGFIPAGTYSLQVGSGTSCPPVPGPSIKDPAFSTELGTTLTVTYSPTNTTNPNLASYYVTGAVTNVGTITLRSGGICPE